MNKNKIKQKRPIGGFVANYLKLSHVKKSWGDSWKERFEIGTPFPTPKFSERQLIKKGLFGLYMKEK